MRSSTISEGGIALTGYVVPGCVKDGTWMLWEKASVVVAVLARYLLDKFLKNRNFSHFHETLLSGTFIFKKVVFQP